MAINGSVTKLRHSEDRRHSRTSLFVAATLSVGSDSFPVRVRDLSSEGALIEGAILPTSGTNVRLSRGSLNVTGEVVWCRGGRAGLRFVSSLSVAEWLPRGRALAAQQRVDEIVQQVKGSGTVTSISASRVAMFQSSTLSAVELTRLRVALESLAEDLAADPDIVKRHMAKLQTLDITAQALRKLAAGR